MYWLQLAVAAIIPMVVGFLWYGPMLFQNVWMKSIGMTEEKQKQGNMPVIFGVSFVMSFILAMFVAYAVRHDPESLSPFIHGLMHGAMIGFFTAMPVLVTNSLFEQKTTVNMLINVGYWILTIGLMGGVLGGWQ